MVREEDQHMEGEDDEKGWESEFEDEEAVR